LRLNFSTTWNWCLLKKIKCPPNTGFLTTFHLHTYMESSEFPYSKPLPCLVEYLHFGLSTWLIGRIEWKTSLIRSWLWNALMGASHPWGYWCQ
jgi:hypothetical protein